MSGNENNASNYLQFHLLDPWANPDEKTRGSNNNNGSIIYYDMRNNVIPSKY